MGLGKLSRRLFLLTLVALIPAAVVLFYNVDSLRRSRQQEMRDDALRAAQLASIEIQRILTGAENVLIALSAAPIVQGQDAAACLDYLDRAGARLPQFSGIAVTDMQGIIVCNDAADGIGKSLADRMYFKEIIAGRSVVVGSYSFGRVSQRATLPLALPVKGRDGVTKGVIVGGLSLGWLGQTLRERDFPKNGVLTVADRSGTIIAHEPDAEKFVGHRLSEDALRSAQSQSPGITEVTGADGKRRMVGYYPFAATESGLYVSAALSTADTFAGFREAARIGLVVTLLSLLLSFVLAWFTSRELIRRPVGRLISTIQEWRNGNEAARTGMSEESGEFGIVGKAIDDFLCELKATREKADEAEKKRDLLVAELDHRVKNLVATVQAVARQTFKDTEDPEAAIVSFNRRLVAMSEAHGLLMAQDWESARMNDVVRASIRLFDDGRNSRFDISGPDFSINAKAVLSLSMALHELCTNAAKYGALTSGEGRIAIHWDIAGDEPQAADSFRFSWTEAGGPAVTPPEKTGFGSKMIERVLAAELDALVSIEYPPAGVILRLSAPLSRLGVDTDLP